MQVPTRRADKLPRTKSDPHITAEKFRELQKKLERMIKINRPRESEEVKRLALMGDFSENAGYQLAKSRLRSLNYRILEIEDLLKRAEIIAPQENKNIVQLGNSVTVEVNGKTKDYRILGSNETNPTTGIISHNSPLGSALIGKKIGEVIDIQLADKIVKYKIIGIK
ncbi:MAG: GreA/GreB family elongation factor [Patescibacteria group bacterium]|jgi:transcription elongation factor GreA